MRRAYTEELREKMLKETTGYLTSRLSIPSDSPNRPLGRQSGPANSSRSEANTRTGRPAASGLARATQTATRRDIANSVFEYLLYLVVCAVLAHIIFQG